MNSLETCSLSTSVLTLLAGQVFYSDHNDDTLIDVLSVVVMFILVMNVVMIVSVIYVNSVVTDDPHKDFSDVAVRAICVVCLIVGD